MKQPGVIRIVLVGGGTGGHFYPLIAVAERLTAHTTPEHPISLHYFGPSPYNQTVLDDTDISFTRIPAGKRRRYFSPLNALTPFITAWGLLVALVRLYVLYPDVVFSKGGFTSVPVVIAAWLLRIPIVVHESDSHVGRANRLGATFARYIGIAYDEVAREFPASKTALVGIPVRQAFLAPEPQPFAVLNIPNTKPLLLVTGGSLGAERINNLILESLDELLPLFTILHQTGPLNEEWVRTAATELLGESPLLESYFVAGTLTSQQMHAAMSAAAMIVSRAGSGTIYEIALTGKPSIIIPIPEAVSHDQRSNAYAYARTGAASVIEEGNLQDGLLTAEITRIMSDAPTYQRMSTAATTFARRDAAEVIAATLHSIAMEHTVTTTS